MGVFARALAERKSDPLAIWAEMLRAGRASKAGPTVTLENAFKVAALYACIKVLSQGVAQVPFKLFREQKVDGLNKIEAAREHNLYDLITSQPNEWTSSFEFRETLTIHAALGNAYAFKNKVVGGRIAELILLNPGRVKKKQAADYTVTYEVNGADGKTETLTADQVWHVRGPSWDSLIGVDVLHIAREALGLSIALEESHAGLHKNGVHTTGVYSVDGVLNPEQHKKLVDWLKAQVASDPGAPMVLDRQAKWVSTTMSGVDAQHLETRKNQVVEVCRFVGVSPIMVYESDKATTYASAEQMFLAHVIHTLAPWYARIEQSADINLLTKAERAQGYYFKFMAAGLMRGAAKDRAEYYAKALGSGGHPGWMQPDEIRMLEELNPMGGDAAKLPPGSAAQSAPA
jgi:HK97 family phage portal protein